jgi:hypothetical protein
MSLLQKQQQTVDDIEANVTSADENVAEGTKILAEVCAPVSHFSILVELCLLKLQRYILKPLLTLIDTLYTRCAFKEQCWFLQCTHFVCRLLNIRSSPCHWLEDLWDCW